MTDALTIAISGLQAQQKRVDAAASNIANAQTTGAVPATNNTGSSTASSVYKPLNVQLTSLESGGVQANTVADPNGYSLAYDPSSSYANSDGYVAAPDVDYAKETVNLLESKSLYKANISVIKTEDEMLGDLLNTIA